MNGLTRQFDPVSINQIAGVIASHAKAEIV